MADISDVLTILVAQASAAVYPNGTAQASVANTNVSIYAGWPDSTALNTDMAAGKVQVSIYPMRNETNVTRYDRRWQAKSRNAPTLSLTLSGTQVIVGGSIPVPFFAQNLAVLIGANAYRYAVQSSDTTSSIATALAQQIPGASSSGSTISFPAGPVPVLRVGSSATVLQEIRRQKRLIQISTWAPSSALRDSVAQAIDVALADLTFLTMPDGCAARIIYQDSPMSDLAFVSVPNDSAKRVIYQDNPMSYTLDSAALFRRDLRYNIEFATTRQMSASEVVVATVTLQSTTAGTNTLVETF